MGVEPMTEWKQKARLRRAVLLLLILVPSGLAVRFMAEALPHHGRTVLEIAILVVSFILILTISLGFWTALFGFFTLFRRVDRWAINKNFAELPPIPEHVRSAILVPVCNEDIDRVLAGVQVIYESLIRAGFLSRFDFFILSDTSDPDKWVEEEAAWADFLKRMDARGRVFYRRRRVNLKRKSGNVADFCRRHGQAYPYMVVLDADSLMSGETLVRMVQIMEQNPRLGILQTAPVGINRESLLARMQQFASNLYGHMYAAGLHYWLLGNSLFWGHNAIIRVQPFMEHCGLPRLSGKPPLGGDIMSHDFVESSMISRSGWEVWLAYDLGGSYEEFPTTLLDELKRDRRWCQGNLQHLRLALMPGFRPIQRLLFFIGAMSYLSAMFWFLLLVLSTAEALVVSLGDQVYFSVGRTLFPNWPVWSVLWGVILLISTVALLFVPKFMTVFLVTFRERSAWLYGGFFRMMASVFLEMIFSTLLAPIRMIFHSKFVFITLMGQQAGWKSQRRDDHGTSLAEGFRFHGLGALLAAGWGTLIFLFNRPVFYWFVPILGALFLAPIVSSITSRASWGRWFRRHRLFMIPDEIDASPEVWRLEEILAKPEIKTGLKAAPGFVRAVVDPEIHALHLGLLRGPRSMAPRIRETRRLIMEKALTAGPLGLKDKEKTRLLSDYELLGELHQAVWSLPANRLESLWGVKLG